MMILTGLILSCVILNIQTQNFEYYAANQSPDSIVFPGITNGPQGTQFQRDVLRQIYGGKGNEISASTIADQGTNRPPTKSNQAAGNTVGYNRNLYYVTDFGINLLKNVNAAQSGNVVLSPYSITALLALLQQGAAGQTQQEIQTALGMTPLASASTYSSYSTEIKNRNSRNILRTASNVFVGDSFSINPEFKKIAQNQFDSDITPVSFARSDQAARQINNWVASKTNNKIEKLVSADSIDATTQLVLVNAVYFKGLWEVPFNPLASYDGVFHLSNGQTKPMQFMRMKRLLHYGTDPTTNAQVVVLPFEGNQYSMMVILPSKLESVSGTLASCTSERLLSYQSFEAVETQLEIPKFTVRADIDLAAVLKNFSTYHNTQDHRHDSLRYSFWNTFNDNQLVCDADLHDIPDTKMGLARMFGPYAELEGLGRYRSSTVQISSAVHSAVLSIDETGATAAAATTFAAVALSFADRVNMFKANRPFIVVLWDTSTSLPLFMATIEDPQQ